ncbi:MULTISPECIES: ABC-F family ATP-binding cassette domain-containing protein [Asticcacaulis]|uniref:ABC-F family ATP-binding cassette domain-containing protein n=1 Tax=Asticcacaulis TaxID=76890 RepID=UPI001AE9DA70|nr:MULTISPECIES: ATP-binding cassette domain-containing protein [Asticcacaulis]MBP2157791.1 ATP-binding cassette subfamily F protein uup [Asticcacaulis solisilvae]MDR6798836.1 ATP-binding cassette subfamily F protein uup [Asticcacaulis sp. BE141]
MSSKPPLLALKDVRLMDGMTPLFDGVDIALEPRVRACLVGRNGAGKSTLMRMLSGLIEPDSGERYMQQGIRFAHVLQEPEPKGDTILDWACSGGAEHYTAESELWAFGIDPSGPTTSMSGGEKRRAALAKAFAEDPDLIFLDEPTNHLDIFAIETLEDRLRAFRGAALIVSHDRTFLERVTQRCYWLYERRILRRDEGYKGFDEWQAKMEAETAESLRRLEKAIERETYTFYRSITAQRTRNEGRAARLEAMRRDHAERMKLMDKPMEIVIDSGATSGKLVAELRGISKSFGDKTLLKNFSTRIIRGDRLAIVGPNGAGKSTLVKLLIGQIPADSGEIKLGTNLDVAYLDQGRDALKGDETLWDVLANSGSDSIMVRGQPRHVAAYAKDFLFREKQLRQPVKSLSGGERNRLQLARALAKATNLLVLDEPTNDLDMDTLDLLEDLLADYDGTLILVSHDRDFIDRLATSTLALNGDGKTAETPGGWQDFIRQNPDFFAEISQKEAQKIKADAPKAAPAPVKSAPKKLSYKDQKRLEDLNQLMPKWTVEIKKLETVLDDATLYSRDPKTFDATMKKLDQLRSDLENGEMEWLELEEKRESLAG